MSKPKTYKGLRVLAAEAAVEPAVPWTWEDFRAALEAPPRPRIPPHEYMRQLLALYQSEDT